MYRDTKELFEGFEVFNFKTPKKIFSENLLIFLRFFFQVKLISLILKFFSLFYCFNEENKNKQQKFHRKVLFLCIFTFHLS